jgi:hypothetical protein
MPRPGVEAVLREKYAALAPVLNERRRRWWAAAGAQALGRGGQTLLVKVTGMSRRTLNLGMQELAQRTRRHVAEEHTATALGSAFCRSTP